LQIAPRNREKDIMLRSQFAAAGIGICLVSLLAAQPADTRAPIPKKADTAAADKLVHDIFKVDFAKTKPADRTALAEKLLEQAEGSKDDVNARYVLLSEAATAAAKAGDAVTFLKAAEAMSKSYKISLAEAQAAGVDTLANSFLKDSALAAAQPLLDAADAALGTGEFDAAQKLLRAADSASRKGGAKEVTASVGLRTKSLTALRKEFEKLGDARKKLETAPTDGEANLLLGRFLCFVKNDWEAGLPRLVLGSDTTLRAAAEKDDKANTGTSAEKAEAGEVWYKLAASADALQKSNMLAHSLVRYKDALSDATGLAKIKIEKRVEELTKATAGPTTPGVAAAGVGAPAWNVIRQAIKDNTVKEWTAGNTPINYPKFVDAPKEGAILIGFRYAGTVTHIEYLQPIYRNEKGREINGNTYGRPIGSLGIVKAKDGYAIGSLVVHSSNLYLYGLEPTFVKVKDATLDSSDSYKVGRIGGQFNSDTVGDGTSPIIGIHGRVNPSSAAVISFGVFTVPTDGSMPTKKKTK
jgi:hypothetical protein